jgi:hypothetical protein
MSENPSFFAELKRRNVYKVAVAYAVVAWLLFQPGNLERHRNRLVKSRVLR